MGIGGSSYPKTSVSRYYLLDAPIVMNRRRLIEIIDLQPEKIICMHGKDFHLTDLHLYDLAPAKALYHELFPDIIALAPQLTRFGAALEQEIMREHHII